MRLQTLKKLSMLLTPLSCVMLASCQPLTQTTVTTDNVVCTAFHDLSYSDKHDTPDTVEGIKENNAAHDAICPPSK